MASELEKVVGPIGQSEVLAKLRETGVMDALGDAVQGAVEMDIQLARWAEEYGFSRGPMEPGSVFLGRFCLYLSQMFLGMRGNPQPMTRMCTCPVLSDVHNSQLPVNAPKHEWPCVLSSEAIRRGSLSNGYLG